MQRTLEKVCPLVAYHIEVARVVECEFAGSLPEDFLEKGVLVGLEILVGVALGKSAKTYSCSYVIDVLDGLGVLSELAKSLGVSKVNL